MLEPNKQLSVQRDLQLLDVAKRNGLDVAGLTLPDALTLIREKFPEDAASLDRRFDPELVIGERDDFDWWNNDDEYEEDDEPFWSHAFERVHLKYIDMKLELLELLFADYVHEGLGVFGCFYIGKNGKPDNISLKRQSDGEEQFDFDIPYREPEAAFLQAIIKLDPTLTGLTLEQMVTVLRERVK